MNIKKFDHFEPLSEEEVFVPKKLKERELADEKNGITRVFITDYEGHGYYGLFTAPMGGTLLLEGDIDYMTDILSQCAVNAPKGHIMALCYEATEESSPKMIGVDLEKLKTLI